MTQRCEREQQHKDICVWHELIFCAAHLDQLRQLVFAFLLCIIERRFAILRGDTSMYNKKYRHHNQDTLMCRKEVAN